MILIISYPDEDHTVQVMQLLERQGREVVLVDLADFPANSGFELNWSAGQPPDYRIDYKGRQVNLRDAHVGWWRRVRPFTVSNEIVAGYMQAFAQSETSQAIMGMLDAIPCPWINPREADTTAHHKPFQWEVAQEIGLRLPRTLVTNKPDAARAFIAETGVGKTVFKAFLAIHEAWRETRLIEKEDVDKLGLVKHAPVIFQEYIKGVDLRITVVGKSVFAAEIDASETSYPVDMRMVIGETNVKGIELPPEILKKVLELQERLNLKYGAIDMRRTPDGEYYFLEVNPAGQWLFVERLSGLPISQAVADLLATFDDRKGILAHENSNGQNRFAI